MNHIKENILTFVDYYAREQLQFVIDLCNQNSYSYNKQGTDKIAEMLLNRLNNYLPFHQVNKQNEVGDHHILKNHTSSRAIYLIGHTDTVFPHDHPFQKCFLEKDILKGPGTGDMKGGLAVIIYALKALKEIGMLNKLCLTLIFNSDEEIGSVHSKSIFLEERNKAICCIVAECAGMNNEIVISRNGKMAVQIDCFGQDRHVSSGTHEKSSAILELAHKIIAVESLNASLPGVSINVGKIEGGLGPSTVPDHARCLVDIRYVAEKHHNILLDEIQTKISQSHKPGCHSELRILNARPAMPPTKQTDEIFKLIQKAGHSLGQKIKPEHRRGTSDGNFFSSAGVPTLDGFGPICDKDHTPDEYIKVTSLKERTALLALFLLEYGQNLGMINDFVDLI